MPPRTPSPGRWAVTDIDLSVKVSRDALGLAALELTQAPYYVAATPFLGTAITWDRQTVNSRWVDSDYTTSRRRGTIQEQMAVEVQCDTMFDLQNAMQTLVDAFTQDNYTLTVTVDGQIWAYDCEAADYTNLMWTAPRLSACQGQMLLAVPRRPVAVSGF